jgi:hypothetical protein
MATRVLITVDTELTWRHFTPGAGWRENFELSYDPAGVGVPFQLRILAEHGLSACFFVDPMPALLYGIDPIRAMVEPILAAGQEVQLHLHPFWKGVADGSEPDYELTGLDYGAQRDLIATARRLLIEAGAPAPVAFRAGSYGADATTLRALQSLGLRYDSSHNGSHHPEPSALPFDPWQIVPVRHGGIVEIPVSQIEDRAGRLRHLQLCAVSAAEMEQALRHAETHRHPVVTLVSHSFELATRDGRRRNGNVCARFERLCAFLAAHRDRLPTARFAALDGLCAETRAAPLPPAPLRRAHRVAEQFWADARYERPATAATALGGSTFSGAELFAPLLSL